MSEQPFNPWNQKMPWTDDSDASSGDDKENIHKKEAATSFRRSDSN